MSVTMRVIGGGLKGVEALAKRLSIGRSPPRELVGVPSGKHEADGTSLAEVAAWTEFGGQGEREMGAGQYGPAQKVRPERPFMRQGIRSGERQIRRVAKQDLREVARGDMDMTTALGRMGAVGQGAVQAYMTGDNFAPNAPATIAKKGSSQPTIDSGSLRGSITHVPEVA